MKTKLKVFSGYATLNDHGLSELTAQRVIEPCETHLLWPQDSFKSSVSTTEQQNTSSNPITPKE